MALFFLYEATIHFWGAGIGYAGGLLSGGAGSDGPNPFEGTSWRFDSDNARLTFTADTWTMAGHQMMSTSDVLTKFDFRGTYTYNGNTASMTATHYRAAGYDAWEPWQGKRTAELDGDDLMLTYHGTERMIQKEFDAVKGYRYIK